jgi:C-terminal processing protease CtpA/Prc
VQQVLSEVIYPYIAASTPQARDIKAYARLLCGPFGTQVILDVIRLDGSKAGITLTRGRYRFPRPPNEFQCKDVGQRVVYVNLPSFGSDQVVREFDKVFGRIQTAQGLILSRLVSKSVPGSHWKSRKHIAAYKAWGRDEQWHEGDHGTIEPHRSQHYAGAVVVLTGPETASAAEDFVVAFQTSGRGRVVGQRTCGSTGQPLRVDLPGGGGARICTKRDTYSDGREFVGIGVIPDVEVEPTREDIALRRDVILEKGVEVLRRLVEAE